jgi:hypothetical protein
MYTNTNHMKSTTPDILKELEQFWNQPILPHDVLKIQNEYREQLRLMELSRNRCDDL